MQDAVAAEQKHRDAVREAEHKHGMQVEKLRAELNDSRAVHEQIEWERAEEQEARESIYQKYQEAVQVAGQHQQVLAANADRLQSELKDLQAAKRSEAERLLLEHQQALEDVDVQNAEELEARMEAEQKLQNAVRDAAQERIFALAEIEKLRVELAHLQAAMDAEQRA